MYNRDLTVLKQHLYITVAITKKQWEKEFEQKIFFVISHGLIEDLEIKHTPGGVLENTFFVRLLVFTKLFLLAQLQISFPV